MSHIHPELLATTGPRGLVRMDFAHWGSGGAESAPRGDAEARREAEAV